MGNGAQIKNVIISSGVTTIGNYAFKDNKALESVFLGADVENIGIAAFLGCTSLEEITVDGENEFYSSSDGILFNKEKTELVIYPAGKNLSEYTAPEGIEVIGTYAFAYGENLSYLKLPESLDNIKTYAFYKNTGLEEIDMPETIKDIGTYAFRECEYLSDITLPSGLKEISDGVFKMCHNLSSVAIPEGVVSIGDSAFMECVALESVVLPESLISIDAAAFSDCDMLSEADIPESVRYILTGAFYGCGNLKKISLSDDIISIGGNAFKYTGYYNDAKNWNGTALLYMGKHLISVNEAAAGSYSVKNGTLTIADSAFEGCTDVTAVNLPATLKKIGGYAFSGCESLAEIVIPSGVNYIGDAAFEYCTKLSKITIPDTVKHIGYSAFGDTKYYNTSSNWSKGVLYSGKHLLDAEESLSGSYTVKSGTLTIAAEAFYGCEELSEVEIPDSVLNIGGDAFSETGFYFNKNNWENGVLYLGKHLLKAEEYLEGDVRVKDGTLSISGYAFFGCGEIGEISLPSTITDIGYYAFNDAEAIKCVKFRGKEENFGEIYIDGENRQFFMAEVEFETSIPGDVTGDGEVTRGDLLRIAKHFSGFEVEIDEAAADVTGDGQLTRADLLRLAKHFSGFDVELGKS